MKIALAQINPTVGDVEANVEKILAFGSQAREAGARLVVFPELAVCGYPPMDLLLKDSFVHANLAGLNKVREKLNGIAAVLGFVDLNPGTGRPLYNSCAVLEEGNIKAVQHKTLLPTYDVFDEDRYFEPASSYVCCEIDGLRLGLSICEDIWNYRELYPRPRYQIDPIAKIIEHRPDVLFNISASPFTATKHHIRQELVRNQALSHNLPVIYVNQVGGNDELIFDGRSIAINSQGRLIARASAFEEDLLIVDLDSPSGTIRECPEDETINTYMALVLGTKDYMHKCGFNQAVIGLSGGIDSAVTASLACRAIGPENVLGIAMPSPYSSSGSVEDARCLAENLGIRFQVIPINEPMQSFSKLLTPHFDRRYPDVTEENIQARLRGLILMALSNKFGYLVLATGNKSELAVGYCTLYGDMCGGLAVISDVPKMMVYDLARYINEEAGKDIIPVSTMEKAPSAELRPNQLDQDTLPPYVVLDGIIHAYVEQRKGLEDIVRLGYRPEVAMDVVNRIDRNEYKRYQAAPGLKVTARSFGFGWRMPIAHRFREHLHEGVS
ncbi:MAG: NAD+ synthase [Candidatus Melainabacteria bacterium]|nr:NAD+ synthase [Candidatus Melainabacteria bacterium]